MKQNQLKTLLLTLTLLLAALPLQAQMVVSHPKNYRGEYKQGEVIVKFKDDKGITIKVTKDKSLKTTGVSTLDKALNAIGLNTAEQLMPLTGGKKLNQFKAPRRGPGGKIVEEPDLSRLYLMTYEETAGKSIQLVIEQLEKIGEIEYAHPNYYVYTQSESEVYDIEPMRSQQWYLDAIRLPELWEIPKLEGAERPIIAIIDTGVDINHPDLADNIWTNQAEAEGAEREDDDNNGFVDDLHGWDFVKRSPIIDDKNGHGTHCAGIAAAVGNNGIGITGANPDALIMPVTVMEPTGSGTISTIMQGIDYAISNGADVISMSFGGRGFNYDVLKKAYQSAILVAAAGNNGLSLYLNASQDAPGLIFPGAFDFVLGVQASNEQNTQAGFSNYDPDGPYFTDISKLGSNYNYEVWAPGNNILSTYPGGSYKQMSGTSMATPLVAGAISRLLQTKESERYRDVWIGDIIAAKNSENTIIMHNDYTNSDFETSVFNAYQAYLYNDENRNVQLSISSVELNDSVGGDGDGRVDAGETIKLYPVVRSDWGTASNIIFSIDVNPLYESASNIEIIENNVSMGYTLSSRGSMRSKNPLIIKVADGVNDGHRLRLRITATCDNIGDEISQDIEYDVENGVELGGVIKNDLTLYPDVHYIINKPIAIAENATLTILPGVTIVSSTYESFIEVHGKLIAKGTPENPITFRGGEKYFNGIVYNKVHVDTIEFCVFDGFNWKQNNIIEGSIKPYFVDCIFKNNRGGDLFFQNVYGTRNVFEDFPNNYLQLKDISQNLNYSNYIRVIGGIRGDIWAYNQLYKSNIVQSGSAGIYDGYNIYKILGRDLGLTIDHSDNPSWLGASKEVTIRPFIFDSNNSQCSYFTTVDLANMPTRPYKESHGIVWKVVVDGYDAQDEFAEMPPLGVGCHKFEVYYNRDDMDTTATPSIAMGFEEPYNQIPISEDGFWSIKDSVSVYTAYLTITGKLNSDGLNRISVAGAKDHDHFNVPTENYRFNVLVQAAGSMATGFAAEAGMGNVKLTWNNENNDFEDAMGFNVYRYTMLNDSVAGDTIRLNQTILDIEATQYIDYEVTPGETYYYYYKVLSTDLKEYDISNVVAATPLTSTLGDANASGEVDVADVITTVNYAAGMEPRPFIFEAADVNVDTEIDILDVIGIIRIITSPNAAPATASIESVAEYWVKDGVVWLETPVDLAGVQVSLDAPRNSSITPTEDLDGFEKVSTWLADNDYLFLAYNMAGRTISAGRHPILNIGESEIADIRLSDTYGHNVMATPSIVTAVENINADGKRAVPQGIYDLMGRKISSKASDLNRLPHGIYIVNGVKVVK